MTSLSILSTLQQVQTNLAGMFPAGTTSTAASDSSTLESFQQILATLSPTTAGGVLGGYPSTAVASTTGASATAATGGGVTGSQVVADARKYIGVPYVFGGTSANGLDCSGLVQKTYKDLGITLPRLVHQQEAMGTAVPSLAQAQPGDLIVFKGAGHIAIYEGNGRVLHAPSPGRFVTDQKLWVNDSGIEAIRRIVPSAGTPDAASGAAASGATASAPTIASGSTAVGSSAAVQAAALATVQAIMQADFGLLSSSTSDPALAGLSAQSTGSASSMLQSALSAMTASASAGGSTAASATSSTASDLAARQALATMQAMLVQGRG